MTRRRWAVLALGGLLALASPVVAQEPSPSPPPPRLGQDELDLLQGRSGLAVGSGARALGMAGAFLARADDGTAASWNPAGLSYLRRPEVSIVGVRNSFENNARLEGRVVEDDRFLGYTADFVSFAHPFEIRSTTGAVQLGFQRVFAFNGDRTIERLTPGRPRVPVIFKLDGDGGFDVLALGTGMQLSRKIRAGFALNYWLNGFRQSRERVELRPSRQDFRFDLSGWNLNLGFIWSPIDSLNFGAVAKTGFSADVRLDRRRTDITDQGETQSETHNAFESDDVVVDLPGSVGVGLSWRPRSTLTVSLDYTRTFWSNGLVHDYFTLPIQGEPEPPADLFDVLPFPDVTRTRQKDTEQARVGVEYVLILGRLKWPFRMGYFNDSQYFVAGGGQAPRFDALTFGTGIATGPALFDVAYVYEHGSYLDGIFPTRVKIRKFYASVIFRFERR